MEKFLYQMDSLKLMSIKVYNAIGIQLALKERTMDGKIALSSHSLGTEFCHVRVVLSTLSNNNLDLNYKTLYT